MSNYFTNLKVGYFVDYLGLIKKTIDKDKARLDKIGRQMEKDGVKIIETEDGTYNPFDSLSDEYWEVKEVEQLMHRTFISGVFAFIESEIYTVCRLIKTIIPNEFPDKDLKKRSGIERSLERMKLILKRDFPEDILIREDIKIAGIIRNALMHNDGSVNKQYLQSLKSYITKYPDLKLTLTQLDEIKVTFEYSHFMIDLSKKIFSELEKHHKFNF